MKKKTEKQAEYIRKNRNSEIASVSKLNPNFSCQGVVGEFIDLYLQCEVMAKKLQSYYRSDTGKPGKNELQIQALTASLKHFSINYAPLDLSILFKGGGGTRGKKSARQLRNGYLHNLSPEDGKEIIMNASIFIPNMKAFLLLRIET